MDKECACKGVELYRELAEGFIQFDDNEESSDPNVPHLMIRNKIVKRLERVSSALFDHITTQAKAPGNEQLGLQVSAPLEKTRVIFEDYVSGNKHMDRLLIIGIDGLKDLIHVNTAVKQLLLCGAPDARDDSVQAITMAAETLSGLVPDPEWGDGTMKPIKEALPVIDTLREILGCCTIRR